MGFENITESLKQKITIVRRFMPAFAFFCGFTWDSVTMGQVVTFYDLLLLTTYYFGAALILILLVREVKPEWNNWFSFLAQFSFGGLFSALVVFYFKSSGSFYTFFVVIGLVILLVFNEFLAEKYRSRTLTWAMFAACGTMYLNFLIPHIFHSVRPVWFYLSCILSFAIVLSIHAFANTRQSEPATTKLKSLQYIRNMRQIVPAFGVIVFLVVLYQCQIIPPVPLVLRESYICKDFSKDKGIYQGVVEKQTFWRRLGFGNDVVHFKDGGKIYSMNAIFAPTNIRVQLEQRWWLHDKKNGNWKKVAVVPLYMVGGRKKGWRTYSYIQNTARIGEWKVETALKDGAVLAVDCFTAEKQDGKARERHTVIIN